MNIIPNNDKLPISLTILSNALPPVGFYLFTDLEKHFPKKHERRLSTQF